MSNIQIHQIISCPVPMQAIYYDLDELELIRQPVICLAIVNYYEETKPEMKSLGLQGSVLNMSTPIPDSFVSPMIGQKDGSIIPSEWPDGFLGIEYNNNEETWDDEIREMEKEVETRKVTRTVN